MRPLQKAKIIEVHNAEELMFQVSTYGEFSDSEMERIFNERRRNYDSRVYSNDDNNVMVYRLLKTEVKKVWLNVCKVCAEEDGETIYIEEGNICDNHIMKKYDLYQYITYDTADCYGINMLLEADGVIKLLRKLEDK